MIWSTTSPGKKTRRRRKVKTVIRKRLGIISMRRWIRSLCTVPVTSNNRVPGSKNRREPINGAWRCQAAALRGLLPAGGQKNAIDVVQIMQVLVQIWREWAE